MRPHPERPLLDEERPGRGRRTGRRGCGPLSIVAGLLVLALVVGAGWWVRDRLLTPWSESCVATALEQSYRFTPEQMHHAATIVSIAERRGLPARAGSIAVATAIQESKLRNITYGDRDSVGLFQQRPSQGWGTTEQILDPRYATERFYDALVKVDGWQDMPITQIAQEVQRSAYPDAYADHEPDGRAVASALSGHSPGGLVCRIDGPTQAGDAEELLADLTAETGLEGTADGRTITVSAGSDRRAWGVASWAVAQARAHGVDRVQVGDQAWTRDDKPTDWLTAGDPVPATDVVITLHE